MSGDGGCSQARHATLVCMWKLTTEVAVPPTSQLTATWRSDESLWEGRGLRLRAVPSEKCGLAAFIPLLTSAGRAFALGELPPLSRFDNGILTGLQVA